MSTISCAQCVASCSISNTLLPVMLRGSAQRSERRTRKNSQNCAKHGSSNLTECKSANRAGRLSSSEQHPMANMTNEEHCKAGMSHLEYMRELLSKHGDNATLRLHANHMRSILAYENVK